MLWKLYDRKILLIVILFVGFCLFLQILAHLSAEFFWFDEVGYINVWLLKSITQGITCLLVGGISIIYLLVNLILAREYQYNNSEINIKNNINISQRLTKFVTPYHLHQNNYRNENLLVDKLPNKSEGINFLWLLSITTLLSLLIVLMVIFYGQISVKYWPEIFNPMNQVSLIIPSIFEIKTIGKLIKDIYSQFWYLAIVGLMSVMILVYYQFLLKAIAVIFSISFAVVICQYWSKILLYLHPTKFNLSDPLFNQDIGFYIFSLPVWELLAFWLVGLSLYGLISVCLTYLLSGNSLIQGVFVGFSLSQKRHLLVLVGVFMLVVSLSYWISYHQLLYSDRGVIYGASFTDVKVSLPADKILCLLAVGLAIYYLWQGIFYDGKFLNHRWTIYGIIIYLILAIMGDYLVPNAVQSLIVQPNELQKEDAYIQRTIKFTRQGFDLDNIDSQIFNPQGNLTEADIKANDLTIRNIRLWDQEPLLKTNRELQQIRPYYHFHDADIDRYEIKRDVTKEKQQVLIAARELDYNAVPPQAKTWVNRNLIYTHGYGFTMSPVNTVASGGLPEYFVKDIINIHKNSDSFNIPPLGIQESIPIGEPRIYYGEITNNYAIVKTKVKELDYPSGSDNVYNVYDGLGGINIGNLWKRCLFSIYLKDWRMLLTRDFLPETKVLFRRNINDRIKAIAPFLQFDSDPYLVVADLGENLQFPGTKNHNKNYLYWLIDAYTISNHYPYSDPSETNKDQINYIRNSVKIVIDAYHGTVRFYIADPSDPLINSWAKIFPQMFEPLANLPTDLRSHIRYPVDFFKIQSQQLMNYHITDSQVFYNREDQWQIPNEIYGNKTRKLEPYYVITSLPNLPFAEFILLSPYTPKDRTNLIAWLAARSDGENYGKLLLYNFPKERLIYGTEQIEARINQDPLISQQISLWNRQGSSVIQGNLLVIPINQSLLYVEPIYLEATQNSIPTLVRVIVAYENRIIMAQTLEKALEGIFLPDIIPPDPIIRSLEQTPN
ncbi:UPF0182 family protein [Anabaena sp. FACHB-1237]|uniref:UPF0182 family protein n=1 Tax=Anabaena sp. FACHB-1237 TaxID=2692769 RepID=UPI0016815021|nr:UPF0182 family protein [Anabaena sp. FACHB-1237]MBD2137257.1 UPF0182 family protein [Anabaena sp. FACHB-1237]